MEVVKGEERSTGATRTHFTAVLRDGKWMPLSECSEARFLGQEGDWRVYELNIATEAITARFSRSLLGNERVKASNGMEWRSFAEARRWAARKYAPTICPHCGRAI